MTRSPALVSEEWRRLSSWSIADFVVRGVATHTQALFFAVPAGFGIARTGFAEHLWPIAGSIAAAVVGWAILSFVFTRYRVTAAAVQQQRGALFKRRVNLPFDRIQNVNIVHPFYFRPLGLVSLRVDSAGSTKDEIHISALRRREAEALREYLNAMRRASAGALETNAAVHVGPPDEAGGEPFFSRSLADLVVHGLTNNRAFIAIAGIAGVFWQSGISIADVVGFLGIDFDLVIAGTSLVRLAVLGVIAFVLSIGILALLSVLVSIVAYYGFTIERTRGRLTIRRGLLNRHEIQLKKSRVQLLALKQDWLDKLLGRRNVYLEQITHRQPGAQDAARQKIMVPSVRVPETAIVVNEIWPLPDIETVEFTPISKRYFRKHAAIRTILFVALVVLPLWLSGAPRYLAPIAFALLPALIAHALLEWRRAGIAVVGGTVFVRSGAIGVDYRIFPAHKLQDIGFVQTPLMRRRDVGSLVLRTAAATVRVPYLPGPLAARVVDYCAHEVEARPRPWM